MSRFTTEVRFICESEAGLTESVGFNSIDSILDLAVPKVFNFDFPIYDEAYRFVLEKKILRHFYTREIALETVGLWKLKLQDRLCMIMPYYNKLYESALLDFNPFYDYDLTRDYQKVDNGNQEREGEITTLSSNDRTGTDANNTQNTSEDWSLYSDTPQGGINGVADNTYLTNARKDTSNATGQGTRNYNENVTGNDKTNSTGSDKIHNVQDYLEHIKGKSGGKSYSLMLEEYRKTLLNIDAMVINELNDLFFGLWM